MPRWYFKNCAWKKLGWDDPIPEDKEAGWRAWFDDLNKIKSITVPRCIFIGSGGEILSCELHRFGDASQKAYCAVVYLVYTTASGTYTKLLCSKRRVAPLKQLSIPRLELFSARILAVLMNGVINALSPNVNIDNVRLWLDSKTASFWIYNQGKLKQSVQFCVADILKTSRREQWGHVSGVSNPADIGSRRVMTTQLIESRLWWQGPVWLKKGASEWPLSLRLEDTTEGGWKKESSCSEHYSSGRSKFKQCHGYRATQQLD